MGRVTISVEQGGDNVVGMAFVRSSDKFVDDFVAFLMELQALSSFWRHGFQWIKQECPGFEYPITLGGFKLGDPFAFLAAILSRCNEGFRDWTAADTANPPVFVDVCGAAGIVISRSLACLGAEPLPRTEITP